MFKFIAILKLFTLPILIGVVIFLIINQMKKKKKDDSETNEITEE